VGLLAFGDYHYVQFFNILMQQCLDNLKLQLVSIHTAKRFYIAVRE
jgi:hypothetical protein